MRYAKFIKFNSLSFKVLLAFLVGVVLSIALMVAVVFWISLYHQDYLADKDISEVAKKISKELKFDEEGRPNGLDVKDGELNWIFTSMPNDVAYRILDERGQVILSSAEPSFWGIHTDKKPPVSEYFVSEVNDISYHNVLAPMASDRGIWYLQITVSKRLYAFIHKAFSMRFMMVGILLFSGVLFLTFGACTWITLNFTFRPLRELSESSVSISPRSLSDRLSSEGIPAEITPLVDSFNRVLDNLENGYRVQQDFLANTAHELKTPLALIQAQVELSERSTERDMLLNDIAHMARHVQQLLLLAEVSESQNYKLATVSVRHIVEEVIEFLRPLALETNVALRLTCDAPAYWEADASALFVLLKNLIENALQHTPKNSEVSIDVSSQEILVRDYGVGASDEHLEFLFQRFWRGSHRRDSGAGLGLSICKEIAVAHGWDLSVQRADPGLCFALKAE